jgi:hypothetical protein
LTSASARATGAGAAERPTDYDNDEKILALLERCRQDAAHNPARFERDSQDSLNWMMFRGGPRNQWVWRNPQTGLYEERPYDGADGLPPWVPRCVSNDFANKIEGIVSIFVQSDPAKTARPGTDDDSDIAAADVCQQALPVLEDEIRWPALKRQLALFTALMDKVAVVYFYDNDPKYGTEDIPLYRCLTCAQTSPDDPEASLLEAPDVEAADGYCPQCGSETVVEATGPDGLAVGKPYPVGRLCAELVASDEFSIPSSATSLDPVKLPWILLHNQMDVTAAAAYWPSEAAYVREHASRGDKAVSKQFAASRRALSAPTSTGRLRGMGYGGGSGTGRDGVIVWRLQHEPLVDDEFNFPDGLLAVVIADRVIDRGPLPVVDALTGQHRKGILLRTYREIAGSQFGKPPADDLVPLQQQQNLCETLAFMTAMHHAAPTVFLPTSVTLEDEMTGMPGATVRYRSLDPSARPTIESGTGVHPSLFQLLDRYAAKMDELSGLNAVLQGARPKDGGTPTLGEVQILQERGMASFSTPLACSADFERAQSLLLLDIARQSMWSPRFRRVMGENGQWQVSQFAGADLRGNVDIVIDPLTAWPKSPLMQDMRLRQAVEMGVVVPPQDPEIGGKLLESWGLEDLKPSLDVDRKAIARELDRWKAATLPQEIAPPNFAVIGPAVPLHAHLKRQFLKTEEAEQLAGINPPVYAAMLAHVQMLDLAMQPAPAPVEGGKPAGPDGSAVDAAVNSGALVPEGAAPQPADPLDGALSAGALSPEVVQPPAPGPSIDALMAQQVLLPVLPEAQSPAPPA